MRKILEVMIPEEEGNRDKGKLFIITELPASQSEMWALRVFQALAKSGVDIGDVDASSGMAGIAFMGIKAVAGMNFSEAQVLMEEMFRCIKIAPNPGDHGVMRAVIEEDIEEVSTRLLLRRKVLELHTGFSFPGVK
jgi:hypothetical protein